MSIMSNWLIEVNVYVGGEYVLQNNQQQRANLKIYNSRKSAKSLPLTVKFGHLSLDFGKFWDAAFINFPGFIVVYSLFLSLSISLTSLKELIFYILFYILLFSSIVALYFV